MKPTECNFIQELLPLYAENLVSEETAGLIKDHMRGCILCTQAWENFIRPLPDPLSAEKNTDEKNCDNGTEHRLFARLRKTVVAAVFIVVMSGAGLAYASYNAGKHIGLDDPSYRFAQELELFTEINQSTNMGDIRVNIEKGLFDSTRSVLFMSFSAPVKDMPQLAVTDDSGREYEQKRGRGWQNKYFMFEFQPLGLGAENINVELFQGAQEKDRAVFAIPVDVIKIAQYTKIIYPNQEKESAKLRISLEKAVLGVSESEFRVRFDWPLDGSVAGIGLGRGTAFFPTSVKKIPETPPPGMGPLPPGGLISDYAATVGVNYRPEDPPVVRPALYDLTGRREVEAESGEYRTTQFPCQVEAVLKFAPVEQDSRQLELLLPPVYIYAKTETEPLALNFREGQELFPQETVPFPGGKITIEKIWFEKDTIRLSYKLHFRGNPDTVLPHFQLTDGEGGRKGWLHFDQENPNVVIFAIDKENTGQLYLSLDSIGNLQPREKFTLEMQ